jgi:hypothetical protein
VTREIAGTAWGFRAVQGAVAAPPQLRSGRMQADLRRLALGTALSSTLLVASLLLVSPARALDECGPLAPTVTCTATSGVGNPYPDGIEYSPPGDFTLIVDPTVVIDTTGSGMNGISIPDPGDPLPNGDIVVDTAPGSSITADSSGVYVAIDTGSITIANDAEITAGDEALSAITNGDSSNVSVNNSGGLDATYGIYTHTYGSGSNTAVANSGDINTSYVGILTLAHGDNNDITISNGGAIAAEGAPRAAGIVADTYADDGDISITNSGDITAGYAGIVSYAGGSGSDNAVENSGNILSDVYGIAAIPLGMTATSVSTIAEISLPAASVSIL